MLLEFARVLVEEGRLHSCPKSLPSPMTWPAHVGFHATWSHLALGALQPKSRYHIQLKNYPIISF